MKHPEEDPEERRTRPWRGYNPLEKDTWPAGPTTHCVRVRMTRGTHAEYYARFYPPTGQWLLRDTGAFLTEVSGWQEIK